MENIFIDSPIIVNVLNVSSFSDISEDNKHTTVKKGFVKKIKQQIVWINTDDKKIVNMWESYNIHKLKQHYGKSINNILHTTIKKGGADDDETDSINVDEINFDDDDLYTMLNDDDYDGVLEKKHDTVDVEEPFIYISNIHIYPEDKISEFKKKIYAATRIPPYRQHLWYEFKGKAYPLSYTISHGTQLDIDIRDIAHHNNFYEGIPIDTDWYSYKDEISVAAMDELHLINQIYTKHGVTEYFVMDMNDFIDPVRGNLEQLIKKDLYSIELIYYSFIMKYWPQLSLTVFGEYLKNEEILSEKYPDLAPRITNVKNMYTLETSIVGSNYAPETKSDKWDVPLYISITYSVISVTEQYVLPGSVIYLRNLFDIFELDDVIDYSICNIEVDGRPVMLTKRYRKAVVHHTKVPMYSILFNIKIPNQGYIFLIINRKGNHKIESRWREDQYLDFDMIYTRIEEYVKPVIEKINSFGRTVFTNPLTVIKNDNSVFTDINISMFWKFNISKLKFKKVSEILDSYTRAGIMIKNTTTISGSYDYYFTKGMYRYGTSNYDKFNPVRNQYQYLTDGTVKHKHDSLITKRKRLSITHRFSDIKIEFAGLKEQEYITFYIYILRFFESIPRIKGDNDINAVKKLKQLKEKDPVLYEFKKIYKSGLVYSKLCQQQKQPIMYSEPGKNRVKFWNFTTNEPAYYGCPNPKYPYINFITKHPKNFCIPCCYKIPPSTNVNDKKNIVFNTCMEKKQFSKNKKNIAKSRHILSYGKDMDVGRLSKLPENTLEPLFYDTFSSNSDGIDEECEKDKGYYIFGVPQNIKNVSNIGFLFSISHAMGKNIIDFISESIEKIKKNDNFWNVLLDGTISHHFNTFTLFIDELYDVFIGNKISTFEYWDKLFIDVAKIYWSIDVIHFLDDSTIKDSDNVHLKIPGRVRYWDDYVSTNKHIIVIERNRTFYPIYSIYKDVFHKIGSIATKLYNHTDDIIKKMFNLAQYHIKQAKFKDSIDLYLIKKFTKNSKYNIETQYINTSNLCYGVTIKHIPTKKVTPFYEIRNTDVKFKEQSNLNDENYEDLTSMFNEQTKKSKETSFYIPIEESYYKTDGTPIIFSTPSSKISPCWKTLSVFISNLNTFIQKYSDVEIGDAHVNQTLYPIIEVENWLLYDPIQNNTVKKIIGFRCGSYNYLIQPLTERDALKIKNAKYIRMIYDPYEINVLLSKKHKPVKDERYNNIAKCLYNNYLYYILIIELINVMNKQRNTTIRNRLASIIDKFTITDHQHIELFNLLKSYPNDHKIIKKLLINNITHTHNSAATIKSFVYNKTFNKTELHDIISKSVFDFDKRLFEKFKMMTPGDLINTLKSIFSDITIDAEPVFNAEFPNMIVSCESNHPYCRNKKLMIKKDKLNNILKIIASDILNPVKSKYIFSPVFVKNTVDYFRFIPRIDEHITISI